MMFEKWHWLVLRSQLKANNSTVESLGKVKIDKSHDDHINSSERKFKRTQICRSNQLFKVDKDHKEARLEGTIEINDKNLAWYIRWSTKKIQTNIHLAFFFLIWPVFNAKTQKKNQNKNLLYFRYVSNRTIINSTKIKTNLVSMTLLNQLIKQMFVLIKYAAKVSNVAGNFMNDREFFI